MEKKQLNDEELANVSGGSDGPEIRIICPNCRMSIPQSEYARHLGKCNSVKPDHPNHNKITI